jgi:hypothetical protein
MKKISFLICIIFIHVVYLIYKQNERNKMNDKKQFIYDILKISRGLSEHPFYTYEVVGMDSIELSVFGYANELEPFSKWASKAQREYSKKNKTDARDNFIFRYPQETNNEEE